MRPAEITDVPTILKIFNEFGVDSMYNMVYEHQTLEYKTQWFNERRAKGHPVIVAQIGDDVVGFGAYGEFRSVAGYKYTVEHSVYLNDRCRGKGIGQLLMNYLIEHAKENRYHCMIGVIVASNEVSIKFHLKYGFQLVGTFKEVAYKKQWVDINFYQLILQAPELSVPVTNA